MYTALEADIPFFSPLPFSAFIKSSFAVCLSGLRVVSVSRKPCFSSTDAQRPLPATSTTAVLHLLTPNLDSSETAQHDQTRPVFAAPRVKVKVSAAGLPPFYIIGFPPRPLCVLLSKGISTSFFSPKGIQYSITTGPYPQCLE